MLGTGQGHELYDVELIARDIGVEALPVLADFSYQGADFVVLLDCRRQRLVGNVYPEALVQRLQHMGAQLLFIVLYAVCGLFEGYVGEFAEEIRVLDDVHHLQVLLKAAGDGAGFGGHLGVEEVVATLERALKEAAPVVAGASRHVVCGYVGRAGARGAEPHAEAAADVQQHFRHKVAGVTQGSQAL